VDEPFCIGLGRFILQGRKANEAAYMVGYNSPAQFSREYKRHFGFVPSQTRTAIEAGLGRSLQ
jgi:AraC-like DNA-binding protein